MNWRFLIIPPKDTYFGMFLDRIWDVYMAWWIDIPKFLLMMFVLTRFKFFRDLFGDWDLFGIGDTMEVDNFMAGLKKKQGRYRNILKNYHALSPEEGEDPTAPSSEGWWDDMINRELQDPKHLNKGNMDAFMRWYFQTGTDMIVKPIEFTGAAGEWIWDQAGSYISPISTPVIETLDEMVSPLVRGTIDFVLDRENIRAHRNDPAVRASGPVSMNPYENADHREHGTRTNAQKIQAERSKRIGSLAMPERHPGGLGISVTPMTDRLNSPTSRFTELVSPTRIINKIRDAFD